jgi:hypothetical protein
LTGGGLGLFKGHILFRVDHGVFMYQCALHGRRFKVARCIRFRVDNGAVVL